LGEGSHPRERDVPLLLCRGLSNKEIARELGLSCGTVKAHVRNIFVKLNAKCRRDVVLSSFAFDAQRAGISEDAK